MNRAIFCIFTLLFSSYAAALDLIAPSQLPEWLQKEIAKETKVKKTSKLKIDEFGINAKIKGKITSEESYEGYKYYMIDIGTNTPTECFIFSEFDGTANSFYAMLDSTLGRIAELNKKPLISKFNYSIDSGITGKTPYLALDILYQLGEGSEAVLGTLKGLVARTQESLQYCSHNETGYRKAFYSVFESFVKAAASGEKNDNFFETVFQFTINGTPAGFGREVFIRDAEGDISTQTESAFFIPADASSISRSDSVTVVWSTPEGNVINAESHSLENGSYAFYYTLKPMGDAWVAEGQSQGKEQKYTLKHASSLTSNYGSYLQTAKLLKSSENTIDSAMWMPEVDPSSATTVKLSKIKNNPDANISLNMGPLAMTTLTDTDGTLKKGKMAMGPIEISIKTLFKEGQP